MIFGSSAAGHLHDETLLVGPPGLFRQLVLQTAPLFVQLHHRVLAIFGQNRTLTALLKSRNVGYRPSSAKVHFGGEIIGQSAKEGTFSDAVEAGTVESSD